MIEEDLWVQEGDVVEPFRGANNAIGTLVLRFDDAKQMKRIIESRREWLEVEVD